MQNLQTHTIVQQSCAIYGQCPSFPKVVADEIAPFSDTVDKGWLYGPKIFLAQTLGKAQSHFQSDLRA